MTLKHLFSAAGAKLNAPITFLASYVLSIYVKHSSSELIQNTYSWLQLLQLRFNLFTVLSVSWELDKWS